MRPIQQIQAATCDVAVAGNLVAFYAHAGAAGTVVVTLPWSAFARAARGCADVNGRPFPLEEQPSGRGRRGYLPPARLAAYVEVRRLHEVEGLSRAQAATRAGIKKHTFLGWLRKQRATERKAAA